MPQNQRTRIHLIQQEPTNEQIEESMEIMRNAHKTQFACGLETARQVWRAYPDLVESPEYPVEHRAALVNESGSEPGTLDHVNDECLQPDFEATLRAEAIRYLKDRRRTAA